MPEGPAEQNDAFLESALPDKKKRGVLAWIPFTRDSADPAKRPVVPVDEVYALLEFAANKGVESDRVEALSKVIHERDPDPTSVATYYSELIAATRPVTGRTVLHSRQHARRLWRIMLVTTVFFVLAIGNYIVSNWVSDLVIPEEEPVWLLIKRYAWDYLTPFFWGCLGACVFLLKRVQDAARTNEYDRHLMQGWGVRVLIGGILASIILILFDPSMLSTEALPLRPAAVAFLAGLGVKAVYGGLERLVDELAKRLAGSNNNSTKNRDQGDTTNG